MRHCASGVWHSRKRGCTESYRFTDFPPVGQAEGTHGLSVDGTEERKERKKVSSKEGSEVVRKKGKEGEGQKQEGRRWNIGRSGNQAVSTVGPQRT